MAFQVKAATMFINTVYMMPLRSEKQLLHLYRCGGLGTTMLKLQPSSVLTARRLTHLGKFNWQVQRRRGKNYA